MPKLPDRPAGRSASPAKGSRPAELPGAIPNAMREIAGGKTAILNVMLSR